MVKRSVQSPGSTTLHTALTNAVLKIASRLSCLAWKQAVGVARAMDNPNRIIRFGLPGSSDTIVILPPHGRACFAECKTGGSELRKQQRLFRDAVLRVGAAHIKVTSEDQFEAELLELLEEEKCRDTANNYP